jgi:hypothetical protein
MGKQVKTYQQLEDDVKVVVRTANAGDRRTDEANGGAEGIRTLDLLDAIEARSQLRHGPTAGLHR